MQSRQSLPTPLAQVIGRAHAEGLEHGADSYLCLSYVYEVLIKLTAIALNSGLATLAPEHAYAISYDLVRADSPGTWVETIRAASSPPLVGFLPPEFHPLVEWLTRRRSRPDDSPFREAALGLGGILQEELGFESQ